ncbi:YbaB/EbfC family nucleoid-associated protein [Streptomyces sp. NPDC094468]|uniref:YbaB/EbfC family nucleoid-associated protein n=1 Tax=Streptomyces sp. NPDC094468 TaxID=3366066 RepID=UPI0037F5625C
MTSRYDEEIENLLTLYRKQRAEAGEARRRINEVTGTATAPRKVVTATVSAQGEVTAIEFPTGAYRRMASKELSEIMLATLRQARARALTSAADITSAGLPAGVNITDLIEGKVDVAAILDDEPKSPPSVGEYLSHGRPDVAKDGNS